MQDRATSNVPDARIARLRRGINLPFWFWIRPKTLPEIEARFTDTDFALIRRLGLTVVRVPIDLELLKDESRADLLNPDSLAVLDRALDKLAAHDLAAIVEIHNTSNQDNETGIFSSRLEREPAFLDLFARFWRSFAGYLSHRDPDMIFPEVLNEPVFRGASGRWSPMQARLIAAMREGAPQHTLIATATHWASLNSLVKLPPLPDPNLVYDFHFYEPKLFTHQGVHWGDAAFKRLRNISYPANVSVMKGRLRPTAEKLAKRVLRDVFRQPWDKRSMQRRLKRAADWAERNHTRVLCGEFGVYKDYAPPESRARCLEDVRTTLEQLGIGWLMWDYDDAFGLVKREGDQRLVDPNVVAALGLNA